MIAELRVTPIGSGVDFPRIVAEVVRTLAETQVQYQVHAMGTALEGSLDEILDAVRRCHEVVRKQADRVLIEVSIDDRAGAEGELVRSVERVRSLGLGVPVERLVETRSQ